MSLRLFRVLAACGGFLLAVLWMDLMYDASFLAHEAGATTTMATYYAHVTKAGWMTWLVAAVMLVAVTACILQLRSSPAPRVYRVLRALLAFVPIALALAVVFPAARELAVATDEGTRAHLARTIAWSHVGCFASIASFIGLQLRGD